MKSTSVQDLIATAIAASLQAGAKIMEIYNSDDFDISLKSDHTPLTRADKAAHEIISNSLDATAIPILSEEGHHISFSERKVWELFWLVDPLDGTKEFIKRNGEFTVNIALIKGGTPIAGVVYVPVEKTLYFNNGTASFKALKVENQLDLSTALKLPFKTVRKKFLIIGSKSHMNQETIDFVNSIDSGGKEKEVISKGSSLKLCLVAEGSADIYPRLGPTMEWDTAAGHSIVLGAGKTVNIFNQELPLKYNKENLLNPYFVVQ